MATIGFRKTSPLGSNYLASVSDYIIWFAKDKNKIKYNQIYLDKDAGVDTTYTMVRELSGLVRRMTKHEKESMDSLPVGVEVYCTDNPRSSGYTASCFFEFEMNGVIYPTQKYSWKTNREGMERLRRAERLFPSESLPYYLRGFDDFPVRELLDYWDDTRGDMDTRYVVQTGEKIIERCMLMTTEPGDIVLDPTCGSGTTAFVAEQWGRRWITIDTSRVALAIARQRLMTARFENYRVKKPSGGTAENPGTGLTYKTVPHITLKSIAQNRNLDPIFERHEPLLEAALTACNVALATVGSDLKKKLETKLADKQRKDGKRALTDADERRWKLKGKWEHWEVPFDADEDWPKALKDTVSSYRKAWRAKMDEVNACIAANADQEELVDQPETAPGVRVSGPFTVEGVLPAEYQREEAVSRVVERDMAAEAAPVYGASPEADEDDELGGDAGRNAEAYYDQMLRLLKMDGVTFPKSRTDPKKETIKKFAKLSPLWNEGRDLPWQAAGWWEGDDESQTAPVAIVFGPQYGSLTGMALEEALQQAPRASYTEIVAAAFSFEPEASEIAADEASHPKFRIHQAFIRPDVNPGMEGLLKDQPKSQLFTVFGKPEIRLTKGKESDWTVALEGVDIYDPLTGDVHSTGASKVAAWFLDSDYDGRAFCITQAFFPDQDAWEKIRKALKTEAEDYAFDAYKGTISVPFKAGTFGRIAVKVIDPRGNEVMVVKKLEGK